MTRLTTVTVGTLLGFAPSLLSQTAADKAVFSDTPPDGAPTASCTVAPVRDASKLLRIQGDTPVVYVFACGYNRPANTCVAMTATPGSHDLPVNLRFTPSGTAQQGWSCVADSQGITGWIRTDRLAHLPPTPAITSAEWLGWWQQGKDAPGVKNDRLLITHSKMNAKILHVSGSAYWYGLNNNVHLGSVNADASAFGDTLHVVDGDANGACTIDLVYHPADHNFSSIDNQGCGGMNVRFSGNWQRFRPAPSKSH